MGMLGYPDISLGLCPCKVFSNFYSVFERVLVMPRHLKYVRARAMQGGLRGHLSTSLLQKLPPQLSHDLSTIRRRFAIRGRSSS